MAEVVMFDIGNEGQVSASMAPDYLLQPTQLKIASNVCLNNSSPFLQLRPGLGTAVFTASDNPIALYQGLNGNYVATATKIYTLDGTERLTGLTSSTEGFWTSIQVGTTNYDIFANGTDIKDTTNGTSFTDLSNAPANSKFIASHNGFVWVWGYDGLKLHRSDLRAPETWTSASELDLAIEGTPSGLLDLGDSLMVHTDRMWLQVTAFENVTPPLIVARRRPGLGATCDNPRSLVIDGDTGDVYWFNEQSGLIRWRQGQEEYISLPRFGPISVKGGGATRAHSLWNPVERRIEVGYVGIAGGGIPTYQRFYYYPRQNAFFATSGGEGKGSDLSAAATFKDQPSSGTSTVYGGNIFDDKIYPLNGTTDAGTAISTDWRTRALQAASFLQLRVNRIEVQFTGTAGTTSSTLELWADGSKADNWTVTDSQKVLSVKVNRRCSHCYLRVTDSNSAAGIERIVMDVDNPFIVQ